MSIKNFFVRSESIKDGINGLANYICYLNSENHVNHKDRTKILSCWSSSHSFLNRVNNEFLGALSKSVANKKGGRPPSVAAQSYCFSLPENITPTKEQWRLMIVDIMRCFSSNLDLDVSELIKFSFVNVHIQSNSHINIVISRRIKGISYAKELSRPSLTRSIKSAFDSSVLKVLGIDKRYYKPAHYSRRSSRWKELKEREDLNKKLEDKLSFNMDLLNQMVDSFIQHYDEEFEYNLDAILRSADDEIMRDKLIKKLNIIKNEHSIKSRRGNRNTP